MSAQTTPAEACDRCRAPAPTHKFDCPNLVFQWSPEIKAPSNIYENARWDRAQAIADRNDDLDENWLPRGALR